MQDHHRFFCLTREILISHNEKIQAFMNRERGTDQISAEDCARALENKGEANKLSVLAFRGGLHGRTIGCISCTYTRGVIKERIYKTKIYKYIN